MKTILLFVTFIFLVTLETQAQQDSLYYYQFEEKIYS
jgi:hypothetical protein